METSRLQVPRRQRNPRITPSLGIPPNCEPPQPRSPPLVEAQRSFQSELRMVPSTRREARLLIAYFSYMGNTRRIAQALSERLRKSYDVEIVEIVPTHKRSYLHWLAYSFVPDSEAEIENPETELSRYDVVLLGFPKWTFSCPPVNRYIRKLRSLSKPRFYLFMTYGGFDEQRFLNSMTGRLTKMGCNIVESLTIKRRQIQSGTYAQSVDSFAKRVQEQLH